MPERPHVKLTAGPGADIVTDFDKQLAAQARCL